ncbi:MAG: sulfate permease [Balneolaceae bacterium]
MDLTGVVYWIKNKFTILRWLPDYSKSDFRGDLISGLTVGVMEIPLVMAYAVIVGISPVYGLYGSLIPLLIFPLFTTSRHLSIGIVATDMIIIAAGASAIAEPGTAKYLNVVLLLSLLVGIVQLGMAFARLGLLVNLLSKPVIFGFTAAAPLIISFSQLGNLSGIDLGRSQYIFIVLGKFITRLNELNLTALGIGLFGIAFILIIRRIRPLFPKSLVLLGIGIALVIGLDLHMHGIRVIGDIPSGLPDFRIHEFSLEDVRRLLPTVITLVIVQLMTVVSLGKTFATKYRYPLNPNREFFALGAANLLGSFFQSPPVSGSFSRSAVSDEAGTRTPLSNVICACLIGLTLLFLTPLFYFIPIPILAAIIIVSTLSIINIRELFYLFRTKQEDGYIAIFTFSSVLLIGIQEGILLGIGASLIVVLYRSSRPNMAVLGHIGGSQTFRDIARNPEAHQVEGILILRLDASFSFNNADYIKDFIIHKATERGNRIHAVIVDGASINDLDTTAIESLRSVAETLEDWDIELHFSGLKGPIRDVMLRSGLARKMGGTHFHMSTHHAVQYLLEKWESEDPSKKEGEEGREDRLKNYMEDVE